MNRRNLAFVSICAACISAWPGNAADSQSISQPVETGISNTGPAFVIIAFAMAMLLTLIVRASARHVARFLRERSGRRKLTQILSAVSQEAMDDFIVPGAYGGLTKIDYAVLTSGGILCIQAKHYYGNVFGAADEPQWTNIDGVHRQKFLNPLIQNEGRTRAVQKVVPNVPVANLVVFTGKVQFSTPREKNVIHVDELQSYIAKFVFGPCKISDWNSVWLNLKAAALTDEDSRKDFRAQLSFS